MERAKIDRINELARLSKTRELTREEKDEQAALRQEYIQAIRGNLKSQLDNIDIVDDKGNIENLGEKYGKK